MQTQAPPPSPVGLTWRPGQLHAGVRELVSLADRTHVGAVVPQPDLLNGEGDAAGPVGHVIALAAPLEAFMLDVVTQELVVGAPPLDRQLRERRAVLVRIETRQRDPMTRLAEDPDHSRYKQNTCSAFNREITDRCGECRQEGGTASRTEPGGTSDRSVLITVEVPSLLVANVAPMLTATWSTGPMDSGATGNLTFTEEA